MSKRIIALAVLAFAVVLLLSACGGGATAPTPVPPTTAPSTQPTAAPAAKIKVGLVTDTGGVNDKSFNQSAWEGVQKAAKDMGFDAKFIESKQPTDYETNIDQFATQNYNVIITVGFLMGDATAA